MPGLNEIILIGVYEDAVFAGFLKDCRREFPNVSIRCVLGSPGEAAGLLARGGGAAARLFQARGEGEEHLEDGPTYGLLEDSRAHARADD